MHDHALDDAVSSTDQVRPVAGLIDRERARGFERLAGSRLRVTIPIRQALVDRLLEARLATRGRTALSVRLLQGARIGVEVTRTVFGFPARARSVLSIAPETDISAGRFVLLHPRSLFWQTLRPLAISLGWLPDGISFGPESIHIDLERVAASRGAADLLGLVESVRFEGPRDGLLLLSATLRVPDAPRHTAAPGAARMGASSGSVSVDLSRDFAGLRAELDARVHESLVNEAIEAFMAASATPRGGAPFDARSLGSMLTRPRIALEQAHLRVRCELTVPEADATP